MISGNKQAAVLTPSSFDEVVDDASLRCDLHHHGAGLHLMLHELDEDRTQIMVFSHHNSP